MPDTLGSYVRAARERKGLSLRDVERATKGAVSNGYLSQLEGGAVKSPSPRRLHALALALGVEYTDLFRRAGYEVPGPRLTASTAGVTSILAEVIDFSESELSELCAAARGIRARRNRSSQE